MATPTALYDLAASLLAAVVAQFAADGVTLPDRRFVTAGEPAADCGQLVVSWDSVHIGTSGFGASVEPISRGLVRSTDMTVWIFRCLTAIPKDQGIELQIAPSVAELQADATTIMTDAYVLHRGVVRSHWDGTFNESCSGLSIGPALPLALEGGIGGVRMLVTAELS